MNSATHRKAPATHLGVSGQERLAQFGQAVATIAAAGTPYADIARARAKPRNIVDHIGSKIETIDRSHDRAGRDRINERHATTGTARDALVRERPIGAASVLGNTASGAMISACSKSRVTGRAAPRGRRAPAA